MERQAPLFVESIAGGLLDKNDGLCPFEGPTLIHRVCCVCGPSITIRDHEGLRAPLDESIGT